MTIICDVCGAKFTGDGALKEYQEHEAAHTFEMTPAIEPNPKVSEYEVLSAEPGDYCSFSLKGESSWIHDGRARDIIGSTNISNIEKLIGKKIRITSYAEII